MEFSVCVQRRFLIFAVRVEQIKERFPLNRVNQPVFANSAASVFVLFRYPVAADAFLTYHFHHKISRPFNHRLANLSAQIPCGNERNVRLAS